MDYSYEALPPEIEAIGTAIVNAAYKVHKALGPGLLEKIYEACLEYELRKAGYQLDRQWYLPIVYHGIVFNEGVKLDMLVDKSVIVEAKAVEVVNPV